VPEHTAWLGPVKITIGQRILSRRTVADVRDKQNVMPRRLCEIAVNTVWRVLHAIHIGSAALLHTCVLACYMTVPTPIAA
jgi:hypothetical protein